MTTVDISNLVIKEATREKQKISIALVGSASGGKTASALILAKGIVKAMFPDLDDKSPEFWHKIWILDTEHNRATAYANSNIPSTDHFIGPFIHVDFTPPFSAEIVEALIDKAHTSGASVVILDSFTSTWEGSGGIYDTQQKLGGRFADWRTMKPFEDRLYECVFRNPQMHIISCIRSKTTYAMETLPTGKASVTKIGLQPVARDNFEYEPWITLHLNMDHQFIATNDKTGLFTNRLDTITEEDGKNLYEWAELGIAVVDRKAEKQGLIDQLKPYLINPESASIVKQLQKRWLDNYGTTKLIDLNVTELYRALELFTNPPVDEENLGIQKAPTPVDGVVEDIPALPVANTSPVQPSSGKKFR